MMNFSMKNLKILPEQFYGCSNYYSISHILGINGTTEILNVFILLSLENFNSTTEAQEKQGSVKSVPIEGWN